MTFNVSFNLDDAAGAVEPTEAQAPPVPAVPIQGETRVGTGGHIGTPEVSASLSLDQAALDAQLAEAHTAEVAAAAEAQALPQGVTPDQIAALKAAGYNVQAPAAPEPTSPPQDPAPAGTDPIQQMADGPQPLGLESFQQYQQEFITNNGALGDESRAAIRSQYNVTDEVIDTVLTSLRDSAQLQQVQSAQQVYQAAGVTEQQFQQWAQWSVQNEDQATREARVQALQSGNPATIKMAMDSLRMAAAGEPALHRGDTGGVNPFQGQSFEQALDQAMNDPRYHMSNTEGDAYRAWVTDMLEKKGGR